MNSVEAIRLSIDMGRMISTAYLENLTDNEMMHRPHADCNHIKWQLGHLIVSEHEMMEGVATRKMPALPDGFAQRYTREAAASDDVAAFDSREELLRVFEEQRAGTLSALETFSDADLDLPSPKSMQAYAPTAGAALSMQGSHWLMHAGQWAVIRRQLGPPPIF